MHNCVDKSLSDDVLMKKFRQVAIERKCGGVAKESLKRKIVK